MYPSGKTHQYNGGLAAEYDSLGPHGLKPTKPLCPWDFPGKNPGVGCHVILRVPYLKLLLSLDSQRFICETELGLSVFCFFSSNLGTVCKIICRGTTSHRYVFLSVFSFFYRFGFGS